MSLDVESGFRTARIPPHLDMTIVGIAAKDIPKLAQVSAARYATVYCYSGCYAGLESQVSVRYMQKRGESGCH